MAKKTVNIKEATQFIEDWKSGKTSQFKSRDVVESGSRIGVILYPLATVGQYQVKWYVGPKPWNHIEGIAFEKSLVLSKKKNPFIYKYSEMVPGPSSDAIDILNEKMRINDEKNAKTRTAKDVEAYVNALEEEIVYKKEMKKLSDKDEEHVDKIVGDEDEEYEEIVTIDPISEKRAKIISEE